MTPAEWAVFEGLLVDSGPLSELTAYAALEVEAAPAETPAS